MTAPVGAFWLAGWSSSVVDTPLPVRAAFYYPWFTTGTAPYLGAWNQGTTPWTQFHPKRGYYDSASTTIIDQHIADLVYGGFDAIVVSWWGPGSKEDNLIATILGRAAAAGTGLNVCLYYEMEGNTVAGTPGSPNPSSSQITTDLNYITTNYTSHPNYLHVAGKPVVFAFGGPEDEPATTPLMANRVAARWYNAVRATTEPWYTNLKVYGGYGTDHATYPSDSWHQYGPASPVDVQGSYSTTISPRFWRGDNAPPFLAPIDQPTWQANVRAMVAGTFDWKLVTSYNEWGEGHSVEAATGPSSVDAGTNPNRVYAGTGWDSPSGYGWLLDDLHTNGIPAPSGGGVATATMRETLAIAYGGSASWVSVHTSDPGSTGVPEASGGTPAYARKQTVWAPGVVDGVNIGSQVTIDVPNGTYTHVGLWSAVTAGTYRDSAAIPGGPVTVAGQSTMQITPTVAVDAVAARAVTAAFTGTGTFTATTTSGVTLVVTAPFTAAGTLGGTVRTVLAVTAAFTGTGTLTGTATPGLTLAVTAAFTGNGILTSAVTANPRTNTFEGQLSGTAWTAANSGGGSGDAFDALATTGTPTGIYDSTQKMHGTRSLHLTCPAVSTWLSQWTTFNASPTAIRFYLYIVASSAAQDLAAVRNAGGQAAAIGLTATRQLTVKNAAGTGLLNFTTPLPLNTWYRVEAQVTKGTTTSNGTIAVQYYAGDSLTAVQTYASGATVNAGTANFVEWRIGKLTSAPTFQGYFDSVSARNGGGTALGVYVPAAGGLGLGPLGTAPLGL